MILQDHHPSLLEDRVQEVVQLLVREVQEVQVVHHVEKVHLVGCRMVQVQQVEVPQSDLNHLLVDLHMAIGLGHVGSGR